MDHYDVDFNAVKENLESCRQELNEEIHKTEIYLSKVEDEKEGWILAARLRGLKKAREIINKYL